jgi:putative thiamine transport system substrate-binding protein
LHPHLWRKGQDFPSNIAQQRQMLDDGEVDVSLFFNPADTSAAIASGSLPETARTFVLKTGTIVNTHFVAIPFNSSSTAGALVVANFLMSPEAQARKQHPDLWGDGTVLDHTRMTAADRRRFDELPRGIATLPPDQLGPTQPNPHPDWKNRIDAAWLRRYGQ